MLKEILNGVFLSILAFETSKLYEYFQAVYYSQFLGVYLAVFPVEY